MSTQQTSPAPAATVFDEPARQIIGQALRDYMREHRIGVPALKSQIENDGPRGLEIPLSTLQRFLAATHQTSEMYVQIFDAFARPLPYYGKDAAIVQTGVALEGFLGAPGAAADLADIEARLHELFAGEYRVYRHSRSEFPLGFRRDRSDQPLSNLAVRAIPGARFFEVIERAEAPGDEPGSVTREIHEGVAVINGIQVHFLLRDVLSRMPRMLSLTVMSLFVDENAPVIMTGESFQHSLRSRQAASNAIRIVRSASLGARS